MNTFICCLYSSTTMLSCVIVDRAYPSTAYHNRRAHVFSSGRS